MCPPRAVTVVFILAASMAGSSAQPSSEASSAQLTLQEAKQLNELVENLYREGKFAEAVVIAQRALALRENALGPNDPDVAESLNNLALLYKKQGAYATAEPLYIRALAIGEKTLGPNHPSVANKLNNLALLYQDQGAYAKAEPLHTRALAIDEEALGPDHPSVATDLNNLALLYQDQGAYAKAEPLHTRALAIRERKLGPGHPDVAQSLNNLALLSHDQGAYAEAELLYTRTLAIDEKALGPGHPSIAIELNNLARLYLAQGKYAQAEPLIARAVDIGEQQLRTELVRLSESRKRALMTLLQDETESVVSLHAHAMLSSSALELALTTVLRRKGRILDSMVESDTWIRSHLTPQLRHQLDRLAQARSELVTQLYAPASSSALAELTATRARIEELESALSQASAEFRTDLEPVTLAKIQTVLPVGTALVELVRYRRDDPRRPKTQRWQEERYVAYILTARGAPRWVALGPAASINAQIDATLRAIQDKAPIETTRAELQRLDALVLAPIRDRLSEISHLIIAPDGKLNLVPFEALVDPQGRYALENYLVSYVTTGRDLLRMAAPRVPQSAAAIIAGPDYGPLPRGSRQGAVSFAPLPGTLGEATDLRRFFPAAPLTGRRATKAALIALKGPTMLHIATHGFHARDQSMPVSPSARSKQRSDARGIFVQSGSTSLTLSSRTDDLDDALDRSGLAMAGANLGPDGIVTAREISGLDWWGTELVVLSACDTGVGAVASFEGVYGLRRALVLAGAASQVVSLWSVNDDATRLLMQDFYGHLARGTGRAEALRLSKRALMRGPGYAHPYYWAAFIPAGDWRPLDR